MLLSLGVATLPGSILPLTELRSLRVEAESVGIPLYKLALLAYFISVPWPVHGLNKVDELHGREEGGESFARFILLPRTFLLMLGAAVAVVLFPKSQAGHDPWPESIRAFLKLPTARYLMALTVIHLILVPASMCLTSGSSNARLYPAPYFALIYWAWVAFSAFLAGLLLFASGVSEQVF